MLRRKIRQVLLRHTQEKLQGAFKVCNHLLNLAAIIYAAQIIQSLTEQPLFDVPTPLPSANLAVASPLARKEDILAKVSQKI